MVVRQRQTLLFVVMVLALVVLIVPAVKAQDDESSAIVVQFDGHSFDLPRDLADGVTAFSIHEPTEIPSGDDSQPPRTEFRLQVFTEEVAAPPAVGWINVYNASDLEGSPAYEQYQRLQTILSERPDLSTEASLPTLYPYQKSAFPPDRYTEFFVNAAYLEAEGYQGITFIFGRVISAGDSHVLFYRQYFEGISADGQRYLSAQIEGLPGFIDSLEDTTNADEYITQAKALFHKPTDEAVIAWIDQANVMFASVDYSAE